MRHFLMFLVLLSVVFASRTVLGEEKGDLGGRIPLEHARSIEENPDQKYFQERLSANKKSVEWSYAKRVRWSLLDVARTEAGLADFMSTFVQEDRPSLRAIVDLDKPAIERHAAEPILREMCSVPVGESAVRGRLFTRANAAQTDAVDTAVESHLARLTLDGTQRVAALVGDRYTGKSSAYVDWESLAFETPDFAGATLERMCVNFRSLLLEGGRK